MADSEWFCVETSTGTQLAVDGKNHFPNKESALAAAKGWSRQYEDQLTVVRYTRKEIRTFQRKVTIEEADVPG